MVYEIQFALVRYLGCSLGYPTTWIYDGIPQEQVETLSVDNLYNDSDRFSADKRIHTVARFQIGVKGESDSDMMKICGELRKALLLDDIPLYDLTDEDNPVIIGHINPSINGETPIHPENVDEKKEYFKTYFDISVSITFGK